MTDRQPNVISDIFSQMAQTLEPDLADDTFMRRGKINDWRNYIPDTISALWPQLTIEQRQLCFIIAEELARTERWD